MLAASVIVTWTLRHKISKFLGAHSNLQGVCRNLLQFGPVVRSFVFLEVMFFACAAWTLAMTPLARWAAKLHTLSRLAQENRPQHSWCCFRQQHKLMFMQKGCEKLKPKSTSRWLPRNSDAIPRKVSSSWHGLLQIYPPGHKPKSFWIDNFFLFLNGIKQKFVAGYQIHWLPSHVAQNDDLGGASFSARVAARCFCRGVSEKRFQPASKGIVRNKWSTMFLSKLLFKLCN